MTVRHLEGARPIKVLVEVQACKGMNLAVILGRPAPGSGCPKTCFAQEACVMCELLWCTSMLPPHRTYNKLPQSYLKLHSQ